MFYDGDFAPINFRCDIHNMYEFNGAFKWIYVFLVVSSGEDKANRLTNRYFMYTNRSWLAIKWNIDILDGKYCTWRKANTQRAIITKAMSFPLGHITQYTRSPRLRHAQQFRSVYCIWLCAHIYISIFFILYEERKKKVVYIYMYGGTYDDGKTNRQTPNQTESTLTV